MKRQCYIILLIAFFNALVYLWIVPPWQHYDEPGHFEYAWLIAQRHSLPRPGDYDSIMRREVLASMIENHFFDNLEFIPNLLVSPAWITPATELSHPPLYYILVSLPLSAVHAADIHTQLYIARFLSVILYLCTIVTACHIVMKITGEQSIYRWAVPAFVAFVPGLTELMTAVNNDVGAIFIFSIFLLSSLDIFYKGFSWKRLGVTTFLACLCAITKNTVAVALVLLLPLFSWGIIPHKLRKAHVLGIAFLGIFVISIRSVTRWDEAALWYVQGTDVRRLVSTDAPVGNHAMALTIPADGNNNTYLRQYLPSATINTLQDNPVTIGAWIWASHPVTIYAPNLSDVTQKIITITTTPAFYMITTTLSPDLQSPYISLHPAPIDSDGSVTTTIWYDGILLLKGKYSTDSPPAFADASGEHGEWDGSPFVNLARNGSFEDAGPSLSLKQTSLYRIPVSQEIALFDLETRGWVYKATWINLLNSFWAGFGWNGPWLTPLWYKFLRWLTIIGASTGIIVLLRHWNDYSSSYKASVLWLSFSIAAIWGAALLRADPIRPFIPTARYVYPAIIPLMWLLSLGWLGWLPSQHRSKGAKLLIVLIEIFNVISWTILYHHYH